MSSRPDHIHLIAIGGTGMAALAGMLKASGYSISGSDHHVYSPMREILIEQGIQYAEGYRSENIPKETALVIIGNAVSKTNLEVQAVIESGIPYLSFPQALSKYFLTDRQSVVVAGTHGKTTAASLMAWVLDQAGWEPGFLIGGIVRNFSKNSRMGKGNYFVVEGDEYDTAFFDKGPKFLHYRPFASILTSIEYDHADIYPDLEKIKDAFSAFVRQIPVKGYLMAKDGDPNIQEILKQANCRVETYGFGDTSTWKADKLDFGSEGIRFRVGNQSADLGAFFLPMSGRQNTLNALAVIGLATRLGVPVETCRSALASFKGIKRRQEVLGTEDGVTVIDDFAHHPTAIGETLSGLKDFYPGRRLWSIFEPRSATSRRRVFQDDFPKAFQKADQVIIALAVIGLATRLGVPVETCRSALASFKGIKRRQEVLGTEDGVTVIDDFAHHPTAIGETLSGLKDFYPGRRLWSIFEPRSATSRRRVFQDDFPKAFQKADQVIIAPIFAPDAIPMEERLDPQKVVKDIQLTGEKAFFAESVEEIVTRVSEKSRPGDVICVMSSGGFDGLHLRLLDALKRRGSA